MSDKINLDDFNLVLPIHARIKKIGNYLRMHILLAVVTLGALLCDKVEHPTNCRCAEDYPFVFVVLLPSMICTDIRYNRVLFS